MKQSLKKTCSRFFVRLARFFEGEDVLNKISNSKEGERKEPIQQLEDKEKSINFDLQQKKEGQTMVIAASQANVDISLNKKQTRKKPPDKSRNKIIREPTIFIRDPRDIRDIMEFMEVPFVALSKKRTEPIIYESADGLSKIKISRHAPHYVASIYDWDIILFVSSKLQECINSKSDIPPRTLIIPRHELLKALHKHDGKKNKKEIEESLSRLQLTGIETTIHNEDYRYRGGFGFLDSWRYTERKDVKEFRITLSEWLYEITCRDGSLLKVSPEYFKITSGLKRFLYRTARKHVGTQNDNWSFSIEKLYEKSGSEQEFKKFKYKIKKAVMDNNIPSYELEWLEENGQAFVRFINFKKKYKRIITSSSSSSS